LAHISELSWSRRINHPKQILKKGDEVEVSLIKIDEKERRLSLSLKDVLENPWGKISQELKVGQIMKGKITKVTNFGAFVEIQEDVEGLIHLNDLSWEETTSPKKVVKEGEEVEFKIMDMSPEERKISCSIKHLSVSPWEKLKHKYTPRTVIQGKISGIVPFGIFVEIEENVEGLIHVSQLKKKKEEEISDKFQKGDDITATVIAVDVAKKRISLSMKEYEKQREKETLMKYMNDPDNQQKMTLGDLINLKPTQ
jgi:small subunit ribosomal protein S1